LEATLKQNFEVETELIVGAKGIFDVVVDGERVYCKHETGEFPDEGSIVDMLRGRA
jgi:predicted Rdx family selenoprotein